ncbi:MAG: cytochrome c3 family protein [Alphaproteobacteria bacterium]|jgi:hypothetical protein|nr:cytochrome c3 family protein [Alphaproteobacteria bacterium]MDP6567477.1 cytochrome c3 family protein [Alphaproteobacteria bacterium]MDP6815333.1 cytochrome c3 family protein [Alphaproteobacteria bacterium]
MKVRLLALTLLFAAGLAIVLWAPDALVNPGALIKGHDKIAGDCFKCHTPLLGPSNGKCVACHKVTEIGLKKAKKVRFHQLLTEQRCTGCHTDHVGKAAAKATRTFDHGLLEPAWRTSCHECHAKPADTLHKNVAVRCQSCHVPDKWRPATFDHRRYFRFDRDHPDDCGSCHLGDRYDRYTCYDCHEHSEADVREEHLEEGIRDFRNCSECHRSADEDEAERIWRRKRRGLPYLRRDGEDDDDD